MEARPVETIDEVINNAKEMLATNRANEALSSIRSRLETDGSMNYELWSLCATTLYMIGHNNEALEAIEELPGIGVRKLVSWVRSHVDRLDGDRSMTSECEQLSESILDGGLTEIFG